MPGAMLCGPCRAALKRARYMSVQVLSPSLMMQGRPRRSRATVAPGVLTPDGSSAAKLLAAHAATALPEVPASPPPHALLRTLAIAVAAVAVLGIVAYFGQAPARDPASPALLVAPLPGDAVNAGVAATNAELPGSKVSGHGTGMAATTGAPIPESTIDDAPHPVAERPRAPRAPATSPAKQAGAPLLSARAIADVYEPAVEPPRPAVVAPALVVAPPPPDRWQAMRDALARCDREGGLGGFICDQRVRLNSCEGYWGQVPQCPLPPENPR